MLVIGLTGQPSSGKDTAANYLAVKGFTHISTSDLIREEMRREGISLERMNMSRFVNEKRRERGNGYLAEEAARRVTGDTIVSGLRNSQEVAILRERFGDQFKMLVVEAPIELRYARVRARGRASDNLSFEQFRAEEEIERMNPSGQEVDRVIAMADFVVENSGTEEELLRKIDTILETIKVKSHVRQ